MIRLKPKTVKPPKQGASKAPAVILSPYDKPLTPQQERFCLEYMVDLNGTQAAIRAGYSPHTANEQSSQLLARLNIRAELDRLNSLKAQEMGITRDKVLGEFAKMGFANMGDYMTVGPDGFPRLEFGKLTRDQTAALQEVTVDEYYDKSAPVPMAEDSEGEQEYGRPVKRVKFKLADKHSALVSLARHLNLFGERDQDRAAMGDASIGRSIVEILLSRRLSEKPANAIEI